MTLTINPTTALAAVNTLLRGIGSAPVNTIVGGTDSEVDMAIATLEEVSREVQTRGWTFNTDYDYTLYPTASPDYHILVPSNVLLIETMDDCYDYVAREGKIYDRENRTNQFAGFATSGVKFKIVWHYDFADLPEQARRYITIRAKRVFQTDVMGADSLNAQTEDDEMRALIPLIQHEARTGKFNLLRDSYSTRRVVQRRSNVIRY